MSREVIQKASQAGEDSLAPAARTTPRCVPGRVTGPTEPELKPPVSADEAHHAAITLRDLPAPHFGFDADREKAQLHHGMLRIARNLSCSTTAGLAFSSFTLATLSCHADPPKPTYDPTSELEKRTLNFLETEPHLEVTLDVPKNLPAARYVKGSTHGFKMEAPYDAQGYLPMWLEVDRAHVATDMPSFDTQEKSDRPDGWYTKGTKGKDRKIASLFRVPQSEHVIRCTTTWMGGMPGFDDAAKVAAVEGACASIAIKVKE